MTTTEDKTYNGWTDYATWNARLWLDNDPVSYNNIRELATDDGKLDTVYAYANAIQDYVEQGMPDLGASMYCDILNHAIANVNWVEIAQSYLDEIKEEAKFKDKE